MSHFKPYQVFVFLLFLAVGLTCAASGQTTANMGLGQKDSSVQEIAKRVDSLQFIVIYNAELLRRDLDAKMILIYVMLGIITIAALLMYALLRQYQRQRKELEENLFHQLSMSVADLEAKIKIVQAGLAPPAKPAVKKAAPKKKGK
jgi:hypothetical protein